MKTCIVIPVYNSPFLFDVINDLLTFDYKIIVVDDGSDSKIEINDLDITLVTHKINMGKGEAILTGAKKAKELGFEYFVTMDADKQHLSSEISKLTNAYEEESIVIGNRNFDNENVPDSSKFGRKFSNFWVNLETGRKFGDTQSGFRIYPVSILELKTSNRRFDFEIEVLVLHCYKKRKTIDVDVECYYPPENERISHFDKVKDNIRLSLVHSKLMIQRFLLLRGTFWY
ncbi:glycosyltransferase family 2 protein [Poseidonibacter antarcticus]|uniref:glycosyltransferase family 2 protein n=1 Tax=Poseidonibacter antarcticus TaxID=2478538 RepID=UPI000EF48670|nr:glycosyltransferase family 2 protein [Poseidonibacter antarcticus]